MDKPVFIDPPQGWQFKFPKQVPSNFEEMSQEEVYRWLIANGYPESEVDYWVNSKLGRVPYRLIG